MLHSLGYCNQWTKAKYVKNITSHILLAIFVDFSMIGSNLNTHCFPIPISWLGAIGCHCGTDGQNTCMCFLSKKLIEGDEALDLTACNHGHIFTAVTNLPIFISYYFFNKKMDILESKTISQNCATSGCDSYRKSQNKTISWRLLLPITPSKCLWFVILLKLLVYDPLAEETQIILHWAFICS